jgi:hypothetical protein
MEPKAHDVLATGVDRGDLWDGEASVGEQHHLRTQSHSPDRLMTEVSQFLALWLSQGHVEHLTFLRLSEAAQIMPIF